MRDFLWILVLSVASGCAQERKYAQVNDVSVPYPPNTGYRVRAVDDAPALRASGTIATVVPKVLVEPGTHKFQVESQDKSDRATIVATVLANKEYRIAKAEDGTLSLVEYDKQGKLPNNPP
jgi:hypothetical protein